MSTLRSFLLLTLLGGCGEVTAPASPAGMGGHVGQVGDLIQIDFNRSPTAAPPPTAPVARARPIARPNDLPPGLKAFEPIASGACRETARPPVTGLPADLEPAFGAEAPASPSPCP